MDKESLQIWSRLDVIRIGEAAWLWAEMPPPDRGSADEKALPAVVGAFRDMLIQELLPRKHKLRDALDDLSDGTWKDPGPIKTTILRELAERKGQRPSFLYPEDLTKDTKGDAIPEDKKFRSDTKESYLLLIGLLTYALVAKSGPNFRRGKQPKKSAVCLKLKALAEKLQIDTRGLERSAFSKKLGHAFEQVGKPLPDAKT